MPFFLQTVLLLLAAYGLWRLWRLFDDEPLTTRALVATGISIRAVGGAILFWVSYLQLGVARSLQLGDGFWFFGLDGTTYLRIAREAAANGLRGLSEISETSPSAVYTRLLGVFCWMFGSSTAVGLLLNVLAYTGMMLIVVKWARLRELPPRFVLVPVVALSFLPSWILWSVQPMKDSLFCFLVVAFAFGVDVVASVSSELFWRRLATGSIVALVAIYGVAGIRWYYALLALAAGAVALALPLFKRQTVPQFLKRFAVASIIIVVSTQLIAAGAGPYLPDNVLRMFRPLADGGASSRDVVQIVGVLRGARENLDAYEDAGTRIRVGPELAGLEKEAAGSSAPVAHPPAAAQPGEAVSGTRSNTAPVPRAKAGDTRHAPTAPPKMVANETVGTSRTLKEQDEIRPRTVAVSSHSVAVDRTAQEQPRAASRESEKQELPAAAEKPALDGSRDGAAVTQRRAEQTHTPAATDQIATSARATASSVVARSDDRRPSAADSAAGRATWSNARAQTKESARTVAIEPSRVAVEPESRPHVTTTSEIVRPEASSSGHPTRSHESESARVVTPEKPATSEGVAGVMSATQGRSPGRDDGEGVAGFAQAPPDIPTTTSGRIVAGLTAMFVPPRLAMSLGLISMTGGRGLWLFADVDTVLFDILFVVALASLLASLRRGSWRDPLIWYLVLTTAVITGALAYAISNYGTLFRHREMVVATLSLMTLAASRLPHKQHSEFRVVAASDSVAGEARV